MKTTKGIDRYVLSTENDNRGIIVRLVVGLIFLTEGVQKYLFPELLGIKNLVLSKLIYI